MIAKDTFIVPLKNSIGGNFSFVIEENLLNCKIEIIVKITNYVCAILLLNNHSLNSSIKTLNEEKLIIVSYIMLL